MSELKQLNLAQINPEKRQIYTLPSVGSWPASKHLFDDESVWAVNAALASRRPLLVRGEPGTGKSQLARAAAFVLGWPFISRVVNARFEPEDLLYRFDAVARLALAQVMPKTEDPGALKQLKPGNFVLPEVLWWAFSYNSAQMQHQLACKNCGETISDYTTNAGAGKTDDNGVVVLIDEIDKADADVPNSLLEALANNGFQAPFGGEPVRLQEGHPPLVVITTNEERELPAAFIRRCLVLHMDLPEEPKELRAYLTTRVRAHFTVDQIHDDVCEEAITQLIKDRNEFKKRELPLPGQAELLDMLGALSVMRSGRETQLEALKKIKDFALSKNRL